MTTTYSNDHIEAYVAKNPKFTVAEIQRAFSISYLEARECIRGFVNQGKASLGEDGLTYTYISVLDSVTMKKRPPIKTFFDRLHLGANRKSAQAEKDLLTELYDRFAIEARVTELGYELKIKTPHSQQEYTLYLEQLGKDYALHEGGIIIKNYTSDLDLDTEQGQWEMNIAMRETPNLYSLPSGYIGAEKISVNNICDCANDLIKLLDITFELAINSTTYESSVAKRIAPHMLHALRTIAVLNPELTREGVINHLHECEEEEALENVSGYVMLRHHVEQMSDVEFKSITSLYRRPRPFKFKYTPIG